MGKFVEILAMTLGGISLFAVCFLGFAITSGKTLEEVPILGALLKVDEPEKDPLEGLSPAEQIPTSTRPKLDIVQHTSGVLGTFSMPSPYSQTGLKELADSIKDAKQLLERRIEKMETESASLTLRSEGLDDRDQRLSEFQNQLDTRLKDVILREQEVKNEENIISDQDKLFYKNKADSLALLVPDKAVELLASYRVEEVAKILFAMASTKSNEIEKALPAERWTEVTDRLARMKAEAPQDK